MTMGELTRLFDVFAPQTCLACGAAGGIFCESCARSVRRVSPLQGMVDLNTRLVPGYAGAIYRETVRDCLVGVKRTGSADLYRLLVPVAARAIAEAIKFSSDFAGHGGGRSSDERLGNDSLIGVDSRRMLAFVPISSGAKTRRGFGGDFVRSLLIDSLSLLREQDQLPGKRRIVIHDHLTPRRVKASQKLQSIQGRQDNIHGAMKAAAADALCATCSHILFDDIMTTGSTMREAARALTVAHIDVQATVSIAARPRALGLPATR